MLLALHEALITDPGGNFQRIWLLVHFGLFLMWQPFFETDQELGRFAIVLLVAITGAILYFLPGWLIGAWMCVLMGILGGKVFTLQAARRGRFYLVAFFYLASMMLLWTVPRLVLRDPVIPDPVAVFAQWLLPLSLLALVFLPFDPQDDDTRQVFDFFYAVLLFQLVVVLVLGSVALMRYTDGEYFHVGRPHGDRLRGDALRARGVLGAARGVRGAAHVPVALPAVGRHALRDLGAARRGARRDASRIRSASSARRSSWCRSCPGCAAAGGRRRRAKASSARRRRTS